jgi:hypothetical protein
VGARSVDVLDAMRFHLDAEVLSVAGDPLICQVLELCVQHLAFVGCRNQWARILQLQSKLVVVLIQSDAYARVILLFEYNAFKSIVLWVVL